VQRSTPTGRLSSTLLWFADRKRSTKKAPYGLRASSGFRDRLERGLCQSRFEVTVRICSRPHAPFGNARAAMSLAPVFDATSRYGCPRCGYRDNSRIPRPRSAVHPVKWPFAYSG